MQKKRANLLKINLLAKNKCKILCLNEKVVMIKQKSKIKFASACEAVDMKSAEIMILTKFICTVEGQVVKVI